MIGQEYLHFKTKHYLVKPKIKFTKLNSMSFM